MEQLDTLPDAIPAVITPPAVTHAEPITDDDIEDIVAKRRSARKEQTSGFCPKCGKAVLLSDRFCPSCGYILK
jgi:hypothetical protein